MVKIPVNIPKQAVFTVLDFRGEGGLLYYATFILRCFSDLQQHFSTYYLCEDAFDKFGLLNSAFLAS